MNKFLSAALCAIFLWLAGCAVGPDTERRAPVPVALYYPEQFAALERKYDRLDAQVAQINALSKRSKIRRLRTAARLNPANYVEMRRILREQRALYAKAGVQLDRRFFRAQQEMLDAQEKLLLKLEDLLSDPKLQNPSRKSGQT